MMRILCVTNLFPNPLRPGRGIFNWRQLRLLTAHAEVRIVSPVPWTDEMARARQRIPAFCDGRWREWDGVTVAWSRYYYTPGLLRSRYGSFLECSIRTIFRRAVAEFRPDLVYACWPYPDGFAAARLAQEFRLPVVTKVHGSDLFMLPRYPARIAGTADALKSADAVIAVGQGLADAAITLGAKPACCHVVHEGVDPALFCPGDRAAARRDLGLDASARRALFVGNLVAVKRVDRLIEACRLLRDDGCRLAVDIVGAGYLEAALNRQIRAAGLSDNIRLRGRIPPAELPPWYRAADAFVLPSDSEGVPNVLMEAAACGTPFVATAVGCVPEISDFVHSELVPAGDARALASGLRRILAPPGSNSAKTARITVPTVADGVQHMMSIFSRVVAP